MNFVWHTFKWGFSENRFKLGPSMLLGTTRRDTSTKRHDTMRHGDTSCRAWAALRAEEGTQARQAGRSAVSCWHGELGPPVLARQPWTVDDFDSEETAREESRRGRCAWLSRRRSRRHWELAAVVASYGLREAAAGSQPAAAAHWEPAAGGKAGTRGDDG